jgi:hypothetical protein
VVDRVTTQVTDDHRGDRADPFDRVGHVLLVRRERRLVHVDQDRPVAGVHDRGDRPAEGEAGGHHGRPGRQPQGAEAELERVGARGERDHVGLAEVGAEFLLERAALGAGGEPARSEDPLGRLGGGRRQWRHAEPDRLRHGAHRRPPRLSLLSVTWR